MCAPAQLGRVDLRNSGHRLGPARGRCVGEPVDRAILSAGRAVGITAQRELAEPQLERVEQHEPAEERRATPEHELDRFGGLERTDHTGQDPEHAALGAARYAPRLRRLGVQAAVARAVTGPEQAHLTLEPVDAAVHVRLAQEHARVADQVACGEVVRPVDHDVVRFEHVERVRRGEAQLVRDDLHMWVEVDEPSACARGLRQVEIARPVEHLALQVRHVDSIVVDEPDPSDPGGCEVQGHG